MALEGGPSAFVATLVRADLAGLIGGVLLLAGLSALWACVLGLTLAWLVARSDVPMRGAIAVLAPLPLTIPPYVAAIAYAALLSRGGGLHRGIAGLMGVASTDIAFPNLIYGPVGAAFILGLFTYPYVFLPARGALERVSPAIEDAARSLGDTATQAIWRVTVPLLRPAITGGGLLVLVYAMVDFGVVSLLRVRTFTTALYVDLQAGVGLTSAARLSLLLVALVWLVLLAQRRALGTARYVQVTGRARPAPRVPLGRARWPAFAWACLSIGLALVVPIVTLVVQLGAFRSSQELIDFLAQQVPYLLNSLEVAVVGATTCLALALMVAWLGPRLPFGSIAGAAIQSGYGIPGTVLGLALIGLYLRWLPPAYGTPLGVALAYAVLFGAHAYQSIRSALLQISPSLEEAARGLGRAPLHALAEIVVPLAWPGLVGAWMLVMVLALRELAATIVLRPAGYDTLAVRIWVHVMDVGPDPRGAAVALLLVTVIAALWLVLLLVRPRGIRSATD